MYNTLYVDADEAGVSSSLSNISGQSYGGPVSVPGQLRSFLFGVMPLDPIALCIVSGALLLAAAMACYIPDRRAARVDPMVALRAE